MEFDKENIPQSTLKKIEKYTKMENFQQHHVSKVSLAAGALCCWVRSLEDYSKALKIVEPKRRKKQVAEELLKAKIKELTELEDAFNILA